MAKCVKLPAAGTRFLYQLGLWKRAVLEGNEEDLFAQLLCDHLMDSDGVVGLRPLSMQSVTSTRTRVTAAHSLWFTELFLPQRRGHGSRRGGIWDEPM